MSIRIQKIQALLTKELALIFQKQAGLLFGGRFITVTEVRVTPDLANATVFLSFLASKDKDGDLKLVNEHNWKIRKLLAAQVGKTMRIVPLLNFKIDNSLDRAAQIDELLK